MPQTTPLPRLMVAPNGARKTKADHPALPMTLAETLDEARACAAAGADGFHLHLRDDMGGHLLDSGAYAQALTLLGAAVPELALQITTEAAERYGPGHQRHVGLNSGAGLISAAVSEITRDGLEPARAFYLACAARGIAVQHILFQPSDGETLVQVLPEPLLHDPALQLIFVLGRYSGRAEGPEALDPYLAWMKGVGVSPDWAVCAFGQQEDACLVRTHAEGGKIRIGFENSLLHGDGTTAASTAERVTRIRSLINPA